MTAWYTKVTHGVPKKHRLLLQQQQQLHEQHQQLQKQCCMHAL
jgi:hypothetical protein